MCDQLVLVDDGLLFLPSFRCLDGARQRGAIFPDGFVVKTQRQT